MSHNPGVRVTSRGYFLHGKSDGNRSGYELLDLQSPGFVAETAKQLALDWIKQYGDELKAIIARMTALRWSVFWRHANSWVVKISF